MLVIVAHKLGNKDITTSSNGHFTAVLLFGAIFLDKDECTPITLTVSIDPAYLEISYQHMTA